MSESVWFRLDIPQLSCSSGRQIFVTKEMDTRSKICMRTIGSGRPLWRVDSSAAGIAIECAAFDTARPTTGRCSWQWTSDILWQYPAELQLVLKRVKVKPSVHPRL
ncbi:unnamed protein product [Chondrus crispus]|uniref:Uncharacterized protein n=1 Tax=Chondrus crispus TaxID=2769 RepID=R7QHX0_CHOCR|nr:unnamed protein product [Chondrus crispus]CDF36995.1 unnamed protein product [Chondrus crispus]|eukprot:XP_005716814.1 unnamed protein product [Chondrus crispus]